MNSGRRESCLSVLDGPHLHNSGVNSATNAVLHLDVEFGDDVGLKGLVFLEIFLGRSIDNVTNVESLDSLILGAQFTAVDADNRFDITSVVFVSAVISPLDNHVVIISLKYIN